MKRGQVTLFIIIGIIILAIAAFFIYFSSQSARITSNDVSFPEVQQFVQSCIERVARDAVLQAGNEGGHYDNETISIFYPSIWGGQHPSLCFP